MTATPDQLPSPALCHCSGQQGAVLHPAPDSAPPTAVRFTLPAQAHAVGTPEQRGLQRDGVRLLRAAPDSSSHHRFHELAGLLEPGDLVVVNTSATIPAAIDGQWADGRPVTVHVAMELDGGDWLVESRQSAGARREPWVRAGQLAQLPGGLRLRLLVPYPDPATSRRFWRATASPSGTVPARYLQRYGRPVEYGHLAERHPLADHQTIYASQPGSAEMPSAGRPFSTRTLVQLLARGVTMAPLVLHTGLSSPELTEPPVPERFEVPAVTARLVSSAQQAGRRIVAVGTTVVRALETAATEDGTVQACHGWTDLVLGPARPARVVRGLITGLHEPEASHLDLLQAVAGHAVVQAAYDEAVAAGYLWHEFGDAMLLLP